MRFQKISPVEAVHTIKLDDGRVAVVTKWSFDLQQNPRSDWADYLNLFSSYSVDIFEGDEFEDTIEFEKSKFKTEASARIALESFLKTWRA